jgi:hypothetical protein
MAFLKDYFLNKPTSGAQNNNGSAAQDGTDITQVPLQPLQQLPEGGWTPHQDGASSSREAFSSTESSRADSLYPVGDLRSQAPDAMKDIKCEVMVNWLHSKQEEKIWTTGEPGEGVVLKKAKGRYVCCPSELQNDSSSVYQMVAQLNVRVCYHIIRPMQLTSDGMNLRLL